MTDARSDRKHMARALELASSAEGAVSPRPPVGCVLVSPAGGIVGEGYTKPLPGPHAEAAAIAEARERARGATAFVSLEPCTKSSVAQPCAEQLVEAGVARVVAAIKDPNPNVNGRGLRRLRAAGISVTTGIGRGEARTIIEPFTKWITTGEPYVTLKMAATLDGKIAAPDGTARWITGPEARAEVHDLRRRVDAVVVGSMTVVRDDPLLTYRLDGASGTQPLRVIVDGSGRSPADARVFNDDAPTLVITTEALDQHCVEAWQAAGAEVARVSVGESGVDVRSVLALLGERGLCHVLIEGGPTIASSFVERGLVDRFVLYLAPKLIGGDAPGIFNDGVKTLADAWRLRIEQVRRVGEDIRIDARPATPEEN